MAHFQVFVPKSNVGGMDLPSVGLEDLVPNAMVVDVPIGPETIGPDGNPVKLGPGKCWSWTQTGAGYYGGEAKWIPAVRGFTRDGKELPAGRYYVGYFPHAKPTPEEMQKVPEPAFSSLLTDDEGRVWWIPVARRTPEILFRNAAGELHSRRKPEYEELFQKSLPFFDVWLNGGWMDREQYWDFCLYVLKWNYRMTPEVMDAIDALPTTVATQIAQLVCDIPTIKKEFEDRERAEELAKELAKRNALQEGGAEKN